MAIFRLGSELDSPKNFNFSILIIYLFDLQLTMHFYDKKLNVFCHINLFCAKEKKMLLKIVYISSQKCPTGNTNSNCCK